MRLIKSVLGKSNHLIEDFVCHFCRDSSSHASFNSNAAIRCHFAMHKIFSILLHDRHFFLRHRTAQIIRTAQRIACQLLHNLHDLFLVNNDTIGFFQYRSKRRIEIAHQRRIMPCLNIRRNLFHRTGSKQRIRGNKIIKACRFQLGKKTTHTG